MNAAQTGTKPYRLGAFVDGHGWIEHQYGRVWQRQPGRLLAAPDVDQVQLILRLAEEMPEPFSIDYFLLVPRENAEEEGRYRMAGTIDRAQLKSFLRRYRPLLEGDGRQHVRIASSDESASITYDQHNVLYLAGPLDRFEPVLKESGLREGDLTYPSPHSHHYHEELDVLLEDMFKRYEWSCSALDQVSDSTQS